MGSPHSGVKWAAEARCGDLCRSMPCTSAQYVNHVLELIRLYKGIF